MEAGSIEEEAVEALPSKLQEWKERTREPSGQARVGSRRGFEARSRVAEENEPLACWRLGLGFMQMKPSAVVVFTSLSG